MTWHTPRTWNVGELVTKTMMDEQIRDNMNYLLSASYPVGSIYMSVVSTNPATLFGFGTWVAWGAGRVPVGLDAGQTEFDTIEETGGAKTHTLSAAEMPAHTHTVVATKWYENVNGPTSGSAFGTCDDNTTITSSSAGSGSAHNNLQPYITCYMWKRTA